MRRLLTRTVLTVAGSGAAVVLAASAAFAATWTVNNPDPTGNLTGRLHPGTKVTFRDVETGAVFSCTASTIPGNAKSGTVPSGTGIAKLAESAGRGDGTFGGCTGPAGSTGSATLQTGSLNAVTFASGTTTGTIDSISATLTIRSIVGTCTGTVTGEVDTVSYTNSNGALTINPDATPKLIIGSTAGSCAGFINPGNHTTFQATYDVTSDSPSGLVSITSP